MITSNHNVIDYIAKQHVIMITLRLLYDYFKICFFTKINIGLKTGVNCTMMSTSNRENSGCLKQEM